MSLRASESFWKLEGPQLVWLFCPTCFRRNLEKRGRSLWKIPARTALQHSLTRKCTCQTQHRVLKIASPNFRKLDISHDTVVDKKLPSVFRRRFENCRICTEDDSKIAQNLHARMDHSDTERGAREAKSQRSKKKTGVPSHLSQYRRNCVHTN